MRQSLHQAYLHTHFMCMDCWHKQPQILLGSSGAEKSCVTSYTFPISGWFLSYFKNYSLILCNSHFLRFLRFIFTIQKKKKTPFSDHLFNAFGFTHFKCSKYSMEESLQNVQPCHGQECTGLRQAVLNHACQHVSRGYSSEQTWLNLQQFCCKMRSSKDKGQALKAAETVTSKSSNSAFISDLLRIVL